MHKMACFWKPFSSERINESQKFLKSAEKYFYPTFSWFWAKFTKKKLFLITSEILLLLDNTLPVNCEYSRINRQNLQLPIQMIWSKKPEISCMFFFFFLIFKIYIKFPMFWKMNEPHRSSISQLIDSKTCPYLNA